MTDFHFDFDVDPDSVELLGGKDACIHWEDQICDILRSILEQEFTFNS